MAVAIGGNQVRLDNGSVVQAQTGGWYDGQQFWNGSLSAPGQFNTQNNQAGQQGAAYVAPENKAYIQQQQASYQPSAGSQPLQPSTPQQNVPGTSQAPVDTSSLVQPSINLPDIYNDLVSKSGVSEKEVELADKVKSFNDAVSKINDNPFLSEANRVGRVQKLQTDFNNAVAGLQNEIATKKADIETQLNLQTKQFDINSQQAKQALDQFQVLLQSGALDGASGQDIANITMATGMSSSMIQSAIDSTKKKNVQTSIQSYDDGTNQGFVVINSQTGEIINKQVIAPSEPKSTGGTVTERREADEQSIRRDLEDEAGRGATWDALFRLGQGFLDPREIYQIYISHGIYNPTQEQKVEDLRRYGISTSAYE